MSNKTQRGQSFFNKVVALTGSVDNAFEMLIANKKTSFTDTLQIGSELKSSTITNKSVVDYLVDRQPATSNVVDFAASREKLQHALPGLIPYSF